ncbi:MAG: C69 family dipeptidase [Candidatus Eisenbacteria bacterium]|nr:C69 family dipeptidase [Candidatus Eisenbacteria bacterium]
MNRGVFRNGFLLAATLLASFSAAEACTDILVTKGASADGSVMITYSCDGEFHPLLRIREPADHQAGDSLEIVDWGGKLRGKIAEIPHTYRVIRQMNEHQLAIGETTFDGRPELQNPEGLLHYWDLMQIALQRARTAREAIRVMTELVDEHGYRSTGESFSIADTEEAWILEMIGPGPGGRGALWVAVRLPDGTISCHANKARIGTFPLDDPENCLYAPNVIRFAEERGWYDSDSDAPFRFCDVYCPPTARTLRYTAGRVWSVFRRAAPSREFSPDYFRGVPGAEPYPLWIEPDEKISTEGLFALMRDHYEGTDFDMTRGVDAGPYGSPYRWRPIDWSVDGETYTWERPISTQQTGFSVVTQSRADLPDPVGGVIWYGVDDTYMTCYTPLYCCIDRAPPSWSTGSLDRFTWDSAWWVFNFVSNISSLRYADMLPEILAAQRELERDALALQPAVERTAAELARTDPELMRRYLTDYSVSRAERVVERWRDLGEHLLTKFNDGYVKDENGRPQNAGYPEAWLRDVIRLRPDAFRIAPDDSAGWRLVD